MKARRITLFIKHQFFRHYDNLVDDFEYVPGQGHVGVTPVLKYIHSNFMIMVPGLTWEY